MTMGLIPSVKGFMMALLLILDHPQLYPDLPLPEEELNVKNPEDLNIAKRPKYKGQKQTREGRWKSPHFHR